MAEFVMEQPETYAKHFAIRGPGDLLFSVDYDDVDREQVLDDARRVVTTLNNNWWKAYGKEPD